MTTSRPPALIGGASDGPAAAVLRRVSADSQGSRRLQEARRGGRAVASRGAVFVAADELAAAARGGSAARDAGAPSGADAAPRRPTGDTARGGDPPAPAEVAAGGDDHHAPKKSCRDPGDPPDTPRATRPTDACHRGRHDAGRDRGAVSERRRVPGVALSPAAPRAPPRTTAAPGAVAARAGCDRTPGGARRVAQRAVHRPVARRSPCHVARGADLPLCPAHDVSRARGGQGSARAARPGRHPAYTAPELVATGPNQVWSWDITKLKGPIPYRYYSLYVILDLFSRYAVGWMVARHENAHRRSA